MEKLNHFSKNWPSVDIEYGISCDLLLCLPECANLASVKLRDS